MEQRDETWLYRRAESEGGVFSRAQAVQAGMSGDAIGRRVRSGRWERLFPGVYRLVGTARTRESLLSAVLLWAGPGAALSHRTAAALWGFDRFDGSGPISLTVPRRTRGPAGVVVHRAVHPRAEATVVRGFRVTSAARTLLDLAATEPEADVAASLDQALRQRWVSADGLASFLARHAGHRGAAVLRRLLAITLGEGGPTESDLEARVLELLDAAGLPRPRRQVHFGAPRKRARVDFHYPGTTVIIEADSYAHHSSPIAFEKDRQRWRTLAARGYRVLPWTWEALHQRPDELVRELLMALPGLAA